MSWRKRFRWVFGGLLTIALTPLMQPVWFCLVWFPSWWWEQPYPEAFWWFNGTD